MDMKESIAVLENEIERVNRDIDWIKPDLATKEMFVLDSKKALATAIEKRDALLKQVEILKSIKL